MYIVIAEIIANEPAERCGILYCLFKLINFLPSLNEMRSLDFKNTVSFSLLLLNGLHEIFETDRKNIKRRTNTRLRGRKIAR